jgi:hypothetical protein
VVPLAAAAGLAAGMAAPPFSPLALAATTATAPAPPGPLAYATFAVG